MGWARGVGINPRTQNERLIGYAVTAKCDQTGCKTHIDRGLAYLCGDGYGMPTDEACGGYFCEVHLFHVRGARSQLCPSCAAEFEETHPEFDEDAEVCQ